MIVQARQAGAPVLVHGADSADSPEVYGEAGATVLPGKPEDSLLAEVAGALGISKPCETGVEAGPAWDLVDLSPYRRAWRQEHGRFSLPLVSSRRGRPIRPAREVAEEMARAKQALGAEHFWFADDVFALSTRWTLELAAEVERLSVCLPFKIQSRCDLMTPQPVAALAEAGCEEVWVGAASESRQVIGEARDNLGRHGIRACYFLQFGDPAEIWAEIQAAREMVRETRPDDVGVSVSSPLTGDKHDWERADDLEMIFQGAYATELDLKLRDAFHAEVEMLNERAIDADPGPLWLEVARLAKTCEILVPASL